MDPHLRVALLGLFCLTAVGCKKHPKPAPDPSIEELRVALIRAAFANFTNIPQPEEPRNQPQVELPSPAHLSGAVQLLTASRASDKSLASWSLFATAVAADFAQGRPTDNGIPLATAPGTGAGSNAQPTFDPSSAGGPLPGSTSVIDERSQLDTDLVAAAERSASETELAATGARDTPEIEASEVGAAASQPPSQGTPLATGDLAARQAQSQPSLPVDEDLGETPQPADEADAKASPLEAANERSQLTEPKPLASASEPSTKVPPKEPTKEPTLAEQAASSAAYASRYGAGSGFTGITAGNRGATGVGAGSGHTGVGAGSGHTGVGAGLGATGVGAGLGHTGVGAGSGYTGIGAGLGFTGIGAGNSGFTGIGASRVANLGAATQVGPTGATSGQPNAANGGAIRGYVFMFTPWGPALLPVAAE